MLRILHQEYFYVQESTKYPVTGYFCGQRVFLCGCSDSVFTLGCIYGIHCPQKHNQTIYIATYIVESAIVVSQINVCQHIKLSKPAKIIQVGTNYTKSSFTSVTLSAAYLYIAIW